METPTDIKAEKMARISILLSQLSLLLALPMLFLFPWLPMSWWEKAFYSYLAVGVFVLYVGINLAGVITAFYYGGDTSSRQRRKAKFLAVVVVVFILPLSVFGLYSFSQFIFG